MTLIENPTPKPGESKQDFISRCIPYVKKEHPSWKQDKVSAVCYSIWNRKSQNSEYEIFTDDAVMIFEKPKENMQEETNSENQEKENQEQPESTKMVAVIGDRFMNGGYLSFEELEKCYKNWENTLHDINHMGTSTGFFLMQQDITYFVGFHKNVKLNKETKEVTMEIVGEESTQYYKAWKGFVNLCEKAGLIPNVSVTYYAKRKLVKASELPSSVDWKTEGYNEDDMVPILEGVQPVCVSTVFRGRCNDKDGCGIKNAEICDCQENLENDFKEQIERIKAKEKKLNK